MMLFRVVFLISILLVAQCFQNKVWKQNFGFNKLSAISKEAKDEQFRIQQEMLQRRKNKGVMKNYFEGVEKRRKEVSEEAASKKWKDDSNKDPLGKWLEAKKQGKINPLGYEPAPSRSDSKLGFNIVIPVNPIGIPKYDNGERFDLRLPYAETGYEDPEADVIGKFMKGISGLFGGKPKAKPPSDNKNSSSQSSNPTKKK
jgi:hypothetical protein